MATKRKPICLALQGGGSHGAFQWGVLDRLLEADVLDIRAVTAASAGAMNAAALITGLEHGGAEGVSEPGSVLLLLGSGRLLLLDH